MTTDMQTIPRVLDAAGTLMFAEAGEGGDAVARFLDTNGATLAELGKILRSDPPTLVVTCARGSSDHAATYAKYMTETYIGVPTASSALSVSSIFGSPVVSGKTLCLAISQSGRSADLLARVKAHGDAGAIVVALVNDMTSPLAELADYALPLCAGAERSVAATKSYIASLAGIAALIAEWSQDSSLKAGLDALPNDLRRAFALDWTAALPILSGDRSLFVIGRGFGLAIAQEAALKLKETCGLHAEAFSSAEVVHGPMAIVDKGFPILAFAVSDETGLGVRELMATFDARGARTALVDADGGLLPAIPALPALEPIVMIQSFYRFANALSVAKGLDPDLPPHLQKVTSTL